VRDEWLHVVQMVGADHNDPTTPEAHWAEQVYIGLGAARDLAKAGIPIFVAYPDPTSATGYRLPKGWQNTTPNPRYIDAWRPGMALCAVMGHVLDLVDLDPRNGFDPAEVDDALTLTQYAVARTTSSPAWASGRATTCCPAST
jgi:hypothetical protein